MIESFVISWSVGVVLFYVVACVIDYIHSEFPKK